MPERAHRKHSGSAKEAHGHRRERSVMTAYETTQDLLATTQSSSANIARPAASSRRRGRLSATLTAAIAAGAMILAIPVASAEQPGATPNQGAVAGSAYAAPES